MNRNVSLIRGASAALLSISSMLAACLGSASFAFAQASGGRQPPVASEHLTVLPATTDDGPTKGMLGRYLKRQADAAFARRRQTYEELKTPAQLAEHQQQMRAEFIERLGGFPERTPLNARVVGTLRGDGFHVEKVIYESQPRHYVTAALYLPEAKPPFPGVLVPCGHSRDGKASNQRVCILLAKYGIAALCYDPIGQGERYQFLDEEGHPRFRATTEHTLLGAGSIPLGRNTATFRIWDGMRSIDYLASREEIDAKRIGVTGVSGGGTLTSYLMALDERVACAAPCCYLTSLQRLLETIGPQDAEQNIFGQIAIGLDHADYVMIRAPKPTLMLVSTHDFFDIDGAWDTFRQAKRFYTRLGFAERVNLVETDAKHGYPQLHREAMLRWMRRWLAGIDEPASEPEFETFPAEDLVCTPRGQVMLIDGARSVVDLNVALNGRLAKDRRTLWGSSETGPALAKVRELAGIRRLTDIPEQKSIQVGSLNRDGYRIDKLVLQTEPGILLPSLLFTPAKNASGQPDSGDLPKSPESSSGRRVLYLHGAGKQADAGAGGEIEKLVRDGNTVLAVDLRGTGETGPNASGTWGGNWDDVFVSYLLGESLTGMRAEDVLTAARFLSNYGGGRKRSPVNLIAVDAAVPPALHAAVLESELFEKIRLQGRWRTFSEAVADPSAGGDLAHVVHGALGVYDLTDLLKALPAETLSVERAKTDQD